MSLELVLYQAHAHCMKDNTYKKSYHTIWPQMLDKFLSGRGNNIDQISEEELNICHSYASGPRTLVMPSVGYPRTCLHKQPVISCAKAGIANIMISIIALYTILDTP